MPYFEMIDGSPQLRRDPSGKPTWFGGPQMISPPAWTEIAWDFSGCSLLAESDPVVLMFPEGARGLHPGIGTFRPVPPNTWVVMDLRSVWWELDGYEERAPVPSDIIRACVTDIDINRTLRSWKWGVDLDWIRERTAQTYDRTPALFPNGEDAPGVSGMGWVQFIPIEPPHDREARVGTPDSPVSIRMRDAEGISTNEPGFHPGYSPLVMGGFRDVPCDGGGPGPT